MKNKIIPILAVSALVVALIFAGPSLLEIGDKITGAIASIINTYVVIISYTDAQCNLYLEPGWNMISTACLNESNMTPGYVFGNLSNYALFAYDAGNPDDPWKAYDDSLPSWVDQDFGLMDRSSGYWINVENTTNITIGGAIVLPGVIPLYPGWNLVSYPSLTPALVNDSLLQIYPDYIWALGYNESEPVNKWQEYTWNQSLVSDQDLIYFVTMEGYWIYSLEEVDWILR